MLGIIVLQLCRKKNENRALYYCSDLMLSLFFQPMAAQLSMKAVLPLAKDIATDSCRSINTGPRTICYNASSDA